MPDFCTDDGCRIAYDVVDDDADAAFPPVVLHHGFGADANINWVRPGVLDALVDEGRLVVTLDARGHGRSEKLADSARYGALRMAADVQQLVDALGFARYDLVGYSMGGSVVAVTAMHDARVRRLVLGGVGGALVDAGIRAAQRAQMGHVVEQLERGDGSAIAEAVGGLFRAAATGNPDDLAALRAAMQANADGAGVIDPAAISAPALVLVGADDPLAPQPDVLAAALPHGELRVVPGDHLGALSHREFRAALLEFLAR